MSEHAHNLNQEQRGTSRNNKGATMTLEQARTEILAVNETVIDATVALEGARTLLAELVQRTGDIIVSPEEESGKQDMIEQTRAIIDGLDGMFR